MAEKEKPQVNPEKLKVLSAVMDKIEKDFGKGAIMKMSDRAVDKVPVIPSGSVTIDHALGIGGYPKGRIIEIFGPESSGKTTLAIHAIAEAQKAGGIAAFIDAEHAFDRVYAEKLGVDVNNLFISQPDNGEQALEIAEQLIRSSAIDIIVIDSVAALNFEEVMSNYKKVLTEIARVYNEAMNIIHYMHDKYYYEKAQMALVDTNPRINLAYGVAGLSIALDSLSAIKYAKVTARRNDIGLTEGFDIQGEFPCFGNDNDKVDHLGVDLVYFFSEELKKLPVYKNARPTLSLLTITSNVMYGKKTGATPDGRAKGVAFAPGANPMHGRDKNGAIASLSSVAKLRYRDSQDGISNTFSIVPKSLGATEEDRVENLVTMMDGYFTKGAHHLNVNVLNREMLYDAMEHPEKYPQLTIRVSGYAVNFVKLSREHQLEVISRSFHERM